MSISVMAVYATTAQAGALEPLIAALSAHPGSRTTTVTTGEHRHRAGRARTGDPGLRAAGRAAPGPRSRPEGAWGAEHDLGLSAGEYDRNTLTAQVFTRFGRLVGDQRPDAVLVAGLTTSICAVALTAFNHGVPVLHLEAEPGGQSCSPYPLEADRRLLERVSTVHLVTSAEARGRLVRRGVPQERIMSASAPAPSSARRPAA
ncbi:UDP-N-acetylglucosamine 2-epimerase [Actinomyces bowdenii]|uniref:UDP-N-acetylglucosamine 2-epimerase n=1 Tax=Actinomyces bowdenii TaxID=131109 RepID=UPI00214BBA76|nr:UDP-N-acetylglucosamine 2-epimerase [Actinomyces bowdenii]